MILWGASRALQLGIYYGAGWALVSLTGQMFLTNSVGTQLGFGVILVIPASWTMSVLAWATFETIAKRQTRTANMNRRTKLAVVGAAALEGLSYALIYLLLLPNTAPVVLMALIFSLGGAFLPIWLFGFWNRLRKKPS
ncbi:hypothetical protein D6T64_04040 [Cryobacterium melibiosiphilum]|uniref:Uncharacterized protein n=1 Tax=Cryobacterium melibiosiphilum TaxID=995039 RepID=A0A3A5MT68_9MICO|nr:hypothetical protein [Cryobacterium melibiosiphilum]RJT90328.1 hypothetical protein D6T64_04040 [Cryobacterium melibiosiphilum]